MSSGEARSAQTSKQSNSGVNWVFTRSEEVGTKLFSSELL